MPIRGRRCNVALVIFFARVTCYALLYFDLSAVADIIFIIYLYAPPLRGTAFSFLTVLITFVSCVSLKLHKLSQMLIFKKDEQVDVM